MAPEVLKWSKLDQKLLERCSHDRADSIVQPMENEENAKEEDIFLSEWLQNIIKHCWNVSLGHKWTSCLQEPIVKPMDDGTRGEKMIEKFINAIAQADVFGQNGSKTGPKWLQPL